ncbi:hypothetical protein EJB05_03000 [Eragrostis curvula]|uniref:Uncharacterized protein n=1 Tax=Eragrostis curvula TaxID=38414 RepID=A0A5J9WUV3_9POAL|nr:hypothetical protein EJB05_03000 [Eragrostis curvula]
MGNILRCFEGEDDHAGGDHYPYHRPTSRPSYQPPPFPYYHHDQPSAAPPRPHQQTLGRHGARAVAAGVAGLDQNNLNFKSTSMLGSQTSAEEGKQQQQRVTKEARDPPWETSSDAWREKKTVPAVITTPTTAQPLGPTTSPRSTTVMINLRPLLLLGLISRLKVLMASRRPQPALIPLINTSSTSNPHPCLLSVQFLHLNVFRFMCLIEYFRQAAVPNIGHLKRSSEVLSDRAVAPRYQCNTGDIDESSAEGLCDAESYAKANPMLIQVRVQGTTKKFWRLTDEATRISRKLALILRSHHSVGKYLAAPLQLSDVWISTAGSVKLRGVRFTGKRFSIQRVRDDYRHLSRVLQSLIRTSGGDITKLPPDYKEFLELLESNTLTMKDEFLIVNNSALLPMSNRTEVFLMLYDRIVMYLGRTKAGKAKKKRILSKLPYNNDWLDTASANTQINQWVVSKTQKQYKRNQLDQLRLNRNVRSHLHQYNDDNIEEILYCEWPELLMDMVKMLHMEGELQGTDIQNKFG